MVYFSFWRWPQFSFPYCLILTIFNSYALAPKSFKRVISAAPVITSGVARLVGGGDGPPRETRFPQYFGGWQHVFPSSLMVGNIFHVGDGEGEQIQGPPRGSESSSYAAGNTPCRKRHVAIYKHAFVLIFFFLIMYSWLNAINYAVSWSYRADEHSSW